MRADYCPMAGEPCQSMCDQPCSAHRLKLQADVVAKAWEEGYRAGINDERMSEANIGIAGFNAKIEPARNNPYRSKSPPAEPAPVPWLSEDEIGRIFLKFEGSLQSLRDCANEIEKAYRRKAGL